MPIGKPKTSEIFVSVWLNILQATLLTIGVPRGTYFYALRVNCLQNSKRAEHLFSNRE